MLARLNAHELSQSRAFSSAVEQSKRPTTESHVAANVVRHFNTSRALKSVRDTSTIDFAYLPDVEAHFDQANEVLRVPIILSNFARPTTGAHAPEVMETVRILHWSA